MTQRPRPSGSKKRPLRRLRIDILMPDVGGHRMTLTGDSNTMTDEALDRYQKLCEALLRRIARHFRENAKR